MIMGILTVLWEKWVEFRRDFYKITLAAMIAPLLYILVFGLGIQTMSHGQSYLCLLYTSIEKANKIMMPIFFVLFVILGIYVAFQPGANAGYQYIFLSLIHI